MLSPVVSYAPSDLRGLFLPEVFRELHRQHGDLVPIELNGQATVLLNNPELIHQVLVKDHSLFTKGSLWWIRAVMGNGVGVAEGDEHKRQRKMLAPAFSPKKARDYAPDFLEIGRQGADAWQPGVHDINHLLAEISLRAVYRTLLGCELEDGEALQIREALRTAQKSSALLAAKESDLPPDILEEFNQAKARLDSAIYRILEQRRGERGKDILSRLLELRDDDNQALSDQELRDQTISIMIAGHDTTAEALSWTLHLLSLHPEIQQAVAREALDLPADPALADSAALPLCARVVSESMRLYPPSWIVSRQCKEAYQLGSLHLEPKTYVRMVSYVTHRDERFFPDPDRFDPDHWLPERAAQRPRFAYFPFGGGQRVCLGEPLAWLEVPLLLATLLRRWRFAPVGPVTPKASIALEAHGLQLELSRR